MPLFLVGVHEIRTQNLVLRRFRMEDANDMYHNWASDKEVCRYLSWPAHTGIEQTKKIIREWVDSYESGINYNWAIEYNNEVIGSIGAVNINIPALWCEIGYCIGKKFWNKGLATEALKAVIQYMFEEVSVNRIQAEHDTKNIASGRVMQKAGMQYEGTLRKYALNQTGIADVHIYSILKEELQSPE